MFYVVDQYPSRKDAARYRTDFFYGGDVKKTDAPRCPKCNAFIGMRKPLPPYCVKLETWGEGFGDFVFWMDDFLVSERFREVYLDSEFRGLGGFEAVEVLSCRKHRKFNDDIPSYFRTMPNRGSAKIDPVASGIDWGDPKNARCDLCLSGSGVLKRWKSVVIDESTWNGDDFFYAYGLPGSLIVSSRLAVWARKYSFKNLVLVEARFSSHDFYPTETASHS